MVGATLAASGAGERFDKRSCRPAPRRRISYPPAASTNAVQASDIGGFDGFGRPLSRTCCLLQAAAHVLAEMSSNGDQPQLDAAIRPLRLQMHLPGDDVDDHPSYPARGSRPPSADSHIEDALETIGLGGRALQQIGQGARRDGQRSRNGEGIGVSMSMVIVTRFSACMASEFGQRQLIRGRILVSHIHHQERVDATVCRLNDERSRIARMDAADHTAKSTAALIGRQ